MRLTSTASGAHPYRSPVQLSCPDKSRQLNLEQAILANRTCTATAVGAPARPTTGIAAFHGRMQPTH